MLALNLIGAAALAAMAVYNGYPFFFFDTHAYYTAGQKAVGFAEEIECHHSSTCGSSTSGHTRLADILTSQGAAVDAKPQTGTVGTGRSVYYGIALFLSDRLASVWLVVAVQALIASWLLHLACRRTLPRPSSVGFLCLIGALTTLSSLPFFVGYLMPDVFAGFYIVAVALLVAFPDRLTAFDRAALWTLLVGSLLFHRSHVLGAALLLGLIVGFLLVFDRVRLRTAASGLLSIGAAIAVGITGFVLCDDETSKITGQLATPPPFLLARVIEDGPGTTYLRKVCVEKKYAVCRFVNRMPMPVTDFLWSTDPDRGVWYVATPQERRQIAAEQFEIVVRSFLDSPLQQIMATTRNFLHQMINFSVMEFVASDQLKLYMQEFFAGQHAEHFLQSRIGRGDIDLRDLSLLQYIVVGGSVLLLLVRYRGLDASTKLMLLVVLCGITVNALVTGTISTPDHRFQSRVIWLLPASAVIVELNRRAGSVR